MDNISIGLLLPTSTILPLSKDFEKGIKEGLKTAPGLDVEIEKEFTGQGGLIKTEDACNRLINYHDVDIITGISSNLVMHHLEEKFGKKKMPVIINNLGEQLPDLNRWNEFMFLNSFHLWRHAWSIGNSGVKKYGPTGMFIGAVYDAGYAFCRMFHEGMMAADPGSNWCYSIPPMPPAGELSQMDVIFPFLEEYNPDFAFVTFCGEETTIFLNEFIKRGWHQRTKLVGLPYLLCPFSPLTDDLSLETTVLYEDAPDNRGNKAFFDLGVQSGKAIARAASKAKTKEELRDALAETDYLFKISNERIAYADAVSEIGIIHNDIKAQGADISVNNLQSIATCPFDYAVLKELSKEDTMGWYNPYLCI